MAVLSKGVTHRDIKPSNLILDGDGRLRILDFGLARLEGQDSLTVSGDFVGTPLYMSPEQARRKKIPVDHRTDVYSLGATMYETFCGRPPFRGKDHADTLSQIIEQDPVELRKVNPRVPKDLETVVLKCIRKDPGDRYGTGEALGQDLRRLVRGDPIEARPEPTLDRVLRCVKRHRGKLVVASVALAALVLIVLMVVAQRRDRRERTSRSAHDAMAEARALCGASRSREEVDLTKWEIAVGAARRAHEMASTGEVGEELQTQAARLLSEVEEAARNAATYMRLERLREERGEVLDVRKEQAEYGEAFRNYGIDIGALEPNEAARRIRASRIAKTLCKALDEWAFLCRSQKEEGARRLLEIARVADTDRFRNTIRDAVLEDDLEKLEELSHEIESGELDSMAVTLLVESLECLGRDREANIELMRKAQRHDPDNFWITYILGGMLQRSKHEEAIGFFRAALALRPRSVGVRDRLGILLEGKGDLDGAIEIWCGALRYRPDFFHVYKHLIPALEKKGVAVTNVNALQEALDLETGDAGAYIGVGLAFQFAKKWNEAVDSFREASQLRDSGDILHYLGRGLYLRALCDSCLREEKMEDVLGEAIAACEQSLQTYEGERASGWRRAPVWSTIGDARKALGNNEGAIEAYKEGLDLYPHVGDNAYNGLLDVLLETKRFDEALSYYRHGIRSGSPLPRFPNRYALALRRSGKHDEAMEFCRGELPRLRGLSDHFPSVVQFRLWLGAFLCNQIQDFDGAIKEFKKTIALEPKNPAAYYFLGNALFNKGDLEKAIEAFQECLKLQPPRGMIPRISGTLGTAFKVTGDLDRTVLHCRRALEFGETARIHWDLGFALLGRGEGEKGLKHLLRYGELEEWPRGSFYPVDHWKQDCEAFARFSTRFSSILHGDTALADPRDQMRFAWLCQEAGLHTRAARFYIDAFAADAGLGDEPVPSAYTFSHRAAAAAAAARAGKGHGKEASALDERAQARWRRQAIVWLQEDLARWEKELERATDRQRQRVRDALRYLKFYEAACGLLRQEGNLAQLPKEERQTCRAFWEDLDRVLARTNEVAGSGRTPQEQERALGSDDKP